MNAQLAKDIRRYVAIKMEEDHIPKSDAKRLNKIFKGTFERADAATQEIYKQNMKDAFEKEDAMRQTVERFKE